MTSTAETKLEIGPLPVSDYERNRKTMFYVYFEHRTKLVNTIADLMKSTMENLPTTDEQKDALQDQLHKLCLKYQSLIRAGEMYQLGVHTDCKISVGGDDEPYFWIIFFKPNSYTIARPIVNGEKIDIEAMED